MSLRLRTSGALALLALGLAPAASAQLARISGVVTNAATGEPLIGTTISAEGTSFGATADLDGRYEIALPAGRYTIVAQLVGFQRFTQRQVTLAPSQQLTLNIGMREDILGTDDVVVVGYGEQDRRTLGGSVASLRPSVVADTPVQSIDNVMQGRLAGVQVQQNSGTPGAALSVRVRGASSISAGNQPLYVVDGVPLNQGDFSSITGSLGGQNVDALADLNPADIESIEVLKDASAAAIYGSRASNGVVLITTKRGAAGGTRIEFNTYLGSQQAWRQVKMLNADQYIDVYNESILADYGLEDYYGYEDDGVDNYEELPRASTDWVGELFRVAPVASTSLSLSGGDVRTRYFVGGTYFNQTGIIKPSAYSRLNGRLNLDYQFTDRLRFGTNVGLTRSVNNRLRSDNTIYGPFANAIAEAPTYPVYLDETRERFYGEPGTGTALPYDNPVALAELNKAEEFGTRIIGNTFAEYDLLRGLSARASVGLDFLSLRSRLYDSPRTGIGSGTTGFAVDGVSSVARTVYEGTLNYVNRGGGNDLSVLGGLSYETLGEDNFSSQGSLFPLEGFREIGTGASTSATGGRTRSTLASAFSRVSFTYQGRYAFTANLRYDGSSRFGTDNRFGFFPAASVTWIASEEAFMKAQDAVSNLRVRLSYGSTGNQLGIGDFASRNLFGAANYANLPGTAPSQLGTPSLQWERTDQFNVGTDFAVFNDRVGVTLDYYNKVTRDLLLGFSIPSANGFASYAANVGQMTNSGFEATARLGLVTPSRPGGFRWTLDLNASTNRNRVDKLLDTDGDGSGDPFESGLASRTSEGDELGYFYGWKTNGLFQNDAELCLTQAGETTDQRNARCKAAGLAFQSSGTALGDVRFVDVNNDGVINALDRTKIGSPWADWTGGVTNTFAFMGFDVSAFFQFSVGNEIYNGTRTYMDAFGSGGDNHSVRALNRWTPTNTTTDQPRATYDDLNNNARDSDRFVEDGSFVRLKNFVVGYSLPLRYAQAIRARSARLYFQGQNLWTSTRYSGFDPEVNYAGSADVTRGTDFYTYPQARTITVGLTLGL